MLHIEADSAIGRKHIKVQSSLAVFRCENRCALAIGHRSKCVEAVRIETILASRPEPIL